MKYSIDYTLTQNPWVIHSRLVSGLDIQDACCNLAERLAEAGLMMQEIVRTIPFFDDVGGEPWEL